jgi:cytochrome c1
VRFSRGALRPPPTRVWIQDPNALSPGTAMPSLGIGPDEARDVAAYLYVLR